MTIIYKIQERHDDFSNHSHNIRHTEPEMPMEMFTHTTLLSVRSANEDAYTHNIAKSLTRQDKTRRHKTPQDAKNMRGSPRQRLRLL